MKKETINPMAPEEVFDILEAESVLLILMRSRDNYLLHWKIRLYHNIVMVWNCGYTAKIDHGLEK